MIGFFDLKKSNQPLTVKNLLEFLIPVNIYKSKSFRNDLLILLSLIAFYSVLIYLWPNFKTKKILLETINSIETLFSSFSGVLPHKDVIEANLFIHILFSLLAILLYDFGFTILHYFYHRVPFLWNLHKVHHSADFLTPLTTFRFHLFEFIFQKISEGLMFGIVFGTFYYFLPENISLIKVAGISIFGIFFSSIGLFRHSHIWIGYGPLSYILISPAMHQIHHSVEPRHQNKNFGQIFSIWDLILGTLYVPKEKETFQVGLIEHNNWNQKAWYHYLIVHFKK